MKDNGRINKKTEGENNFGKMVASMKVTGKITSPTVTEDSFTVMAMYTSANG